MTGDSDEATTTRQQNNTARAPFLPICTCSSYFVLTLVPAAAAAYDYPRPKRRQAILTLLLQSNLRSTCKPVNLSILLAGADAVDTRVGSWSYKGRTVKLQVMYKSSAGRPGCSIRGVWPPRRTELPSYNVLWSIAAGASQCCSSISPFNP
jgi:hypothetical protein